MIDWLPVLSARGTRLFIDDTFVRERIVGTGVAAVAAATNATTPAPATSPPSSAVTSSTGAATPATPAAPAPTAAEAAARATQAQAEVKKEEQKVEQVKQETKQTTAAVNTVAQQVKNEQAQIKTQLSNIEAKVASSAQQQQAQTAQAAATIAQQQQRTCTHTHTQIACVLRFAVRLLRTCLSSVLIVCRFVSMSMHARHFLHLYVCVSSIEYASAELLARLKADEAAHHPPVLVGDNNVLAQNTHTVVDPRDKSNEQMYNSIEADPKLATTEVVCRCSLVRALTCWSESGPVVSVCLFVRLRVRVLLVD